MFKSAAKSRRARSQTRRIQTRSFTSRFHLLLVFFAFSFASSRLRGWFDSNLFRVITFRRTLLKPAAKSRRARSQTRRIQTRSFTSRFHLLLVFFAISFASSRLRGCFESNLFRVITFRRTLLKSAAKSRRVRSQTRRTQTRSFTSRFHLLLVFFAISFASSRLRGWFDSNLFRVLITFRRTLLKSAAKSRRARSQTRRIQTRSFTSRFHLLLVFFAISFASSRLRGWFDSNLFRVLITFRRTLLKSAAKSRRARSQTRRIQNRSFTSRFHLLLVFFAFSFASSRLRSWFESNSCTIPVIVGLHRVLWGS